MDTIGESISRVKNTLKLYKEDAFITDKFIYSLVLKYAKTYMNRKSELNKLKPFNKLFTTINCLELIEVDKIEACCTGIKTGCKIYRTKNPLPQPMTGPSGLLMRNVSSLDGSQEVTKINPSTYVSMTKTSAYKYNKYKYYWYMNDHLYFPNLEWESVRLEGVWEDEVFGLNCCDESQKCIKRQDQKAPITDYLYSGIERDVLQELGMTLQIPIDLKDDKQNPAR